MTDPHDREKIARLATGVEQFVVQYAIHIEASPHEAILGLVDALARVTTEIATPGHKRDALTLAAERLLQYAHKDSPLMSDEPQRADH